MIKKDEAEFPREFQRTERLGVPSGPVRSWGVWWNWAVTAWPSGDTCRKQKRAPGA